MNSGILLIDKPIGYSSNQLLQKVKKKLSLKKVGHFGTLDPFADGLLILGIGCLLYTSPSPRDRTRSRMPSSA